MNLYFMRSNGERKLLAKVKSEEEANIKIREFLNEHNVNPYYFRTWVENGEKWIDFGSWSEFMILDMEDKNG